MQKIDLHIKTNAPSAVIQAAEDATAHFKYTGFFYARILIDTLREWGYTVSEPTEVPVDTPTKD